jgi:hypothetical protein
MYYLLEEIFLSEFKYFAQQLWGREEQEWQCVYSLNKAALYW